MKTTLTYTRRWFVFLFSTSGSSTACCCQKDQFHPRASLWRWWEEGREIQWAACFQVLLSSYQVSSSWWTSHPHGRCPTLKRWASPGTSSHFLSTCWVWVLIVPLNIRFDSCRLPRRSCLKEISRLSDVVSFGNDVNRLFRHNGDARGVVWITLVHLQDRL